MEGKHCGAGTGGSGSAKVGIGQMAGGKGGRRAGTGRTRGGCGSQGDKEKGVKGLGLALQHLSLLFLPQR